MKINTKKVIATTLAVGLLSSGAVFAEYHPDKVIDTSLPYTTTSADAELPAAPEASELPQAPAVFSIDSVKILDGVNHAMIPLREVCETLGYTVGWDGASETITLQKGAVYVTLNPNADSYTFSKMTPISLGVVPVVVDGVTYVPVEFVSEILGGRYSVNEDGTYKITMQRLVNVTAKEEGALTVNDPIFGETIVRITDETVIEADTEGGKAEIEVGSVLDVEYAEFMTASIPPQTNAVRIIVLNTVEEEAGGVETENVTHVGKITAVNGTQVTIAAENDVNPEIVLNTDENTVVTDSVNKRIYKIEDLETGMEIEAVCSLAMTFSLPPQTYAYSIIIK